MNARYVRHRNLRITALHDEGVALHLDTHRYFTVNATGFTLLEALSEARTVDELGAALVAEYDVDTNEAVERARAFIAECLTRNMVVTADA